MNKWQDILNQLETGKIRAAYKKDGSYHPNIIVKNAILESFKQGELSTINDNYVDKHTLHPRIFETTDQIRLVPRGSTVRRGAYISKNVIIMPPTYINIGAYVDEGTLVDSHVLVGSCAQVGKNVHLSAGVKLGGVLEPIGLSPVIIEDDCFIGSGAILVEGVQVSKGAIIAPGVVLSRSIPVYDIINEKILEKGDPIPENAVVVPGSRELNNVNQFSIDHGLKVNTALIIKYRDAKTDAAIELENALR